MKPKRLIKSSKPRRAKLPAQVAVTIKPSKYHPTSSKPGGVKIEVIKTYTGTPTRSRRGRPTIYDFHLLDPGYMAEYSNTTPGAVDAAVSRYKSGRAGQSFIVKRLPNGNVGVWRLT